MMASKIEAGARTNRTESWMRKTSNAGANVEANSVAQRRGQNCLHSARPFASAKEQR